VRWRMARVPITHDDAESLIERLQAEYVVRYGGPDETPYDAREFESPSGAFFVGYLDGRPTATGAWRFRPDVDAFGGGPAAEVKRMFVTAEARRAGLGRLILRQLEDDARASGAEVMVLETGAAQPEAIALYEACGYEPTGEGFGYYRSSPLVRYFGRRLH
jgi:ribosomal protein S18 acetylase RimI-like enzyme